MKTTTFDRNNAALAFQPAHLANPDRFAQGYPGGLYKLPTDWETPLRPMDAYAFIHSRIKSGRDLRACLRAGDAAWPGGYGIFYLTSDGGALCPGCVRENFFGCVDSIRTRCNDGWRVIGTDCMANVDGPVHCDHCSQEIE